MVAVGLRPTREERNHWKTVKAIIQRNMTEPVVPEEDTDYSRVVADGEEEEPSYDRDELEAFGGLKDLNPDYWQLIYRAVKRKPKVGVCVLFCVCVCVCDLTAWHAH